MNTIFIFPFLWLSKTDPKLYKLLPTDVKWTRTALGVFVLLTGVFAFITGSYFISTLLSSYNEKTHTMETSAVGRMLSFIGGLLCATMIVLVNRNILLSTYKYKWSLLIKVPFAVILGLTISIPANLLLFSDLVNKELTMASRLENKVYEDRRQGEITGIDEQIREITAKRNKADESRLEWAAIKEAEITGRVKEGRTGKAGCGPSCKEAERNELLHANAAEKYDLEIVELKASRGTVVSNAQAAYENSKINQPYNFISQYEYLKMLLKKNKAVWWLAVLLTMSFILIEVTFVLIKITEKNYQLP